MEYQKDRMAKIFASSRSMELKKGSISGDFFYKDFAAFLSANPKFDFVDFDAAEYVFNKARVTLLEDKAVFFYKDFEQCYADAIDNGKNPVYAIFGKWHESKNDKEQGVEKQEDIQQEDSKKHQGYETIIKELERAFDAGRDSLSFSSTDKLEYKLHMPNAIANRQVLLHAYHSAQLKQGREYVYADFQNWYYSCDKAIWCEDVNAHPFHINKEAIPELHMVDYVFKKKDNSYKDTYEDRYHKLLAVVANSTFKDFDAFWYWWKNYYIPYIQFAEVYETMAVRMQLTGTLGTDFGTEKDIQVESVSGLKKYENNEHDFKVPAINLKKTPTNWIMETESKFLNGQYEAIAEKCKDIFKAKTADYGISWACMRISSLTDQLLIKAIRIRNIQENKAQAISDSIESEFIGIFNYSLMVLMKMESQEINESFANLVMNSESIDSIVKIYSIQLQDCMALAEAKNTDYGDVWRKLRIESITDLILSKIYRLRQIQANGGKVAASENPKAIFQDIANYAIFALILMQK